MEILKDEKFEIILANINKNVLMTSFKKLAEHAQTGAKLFISGFYESDLKDLLIETEIAGWKFKKSFELNDWCAAQFEL